MKKKKIRFWFDMDGVLARWDNCASIEETHQAGYFASRECDEAAKELVKELAYDKSDDLDIEVRILTAIYEDDHSAKEKKCWVFSNQIPVAQGNIVCVPYGDDKFKYIKKSEDVVLDVLVDDYGKNLKAWQDHGLYAIKYYNGINNQPKVSVDEDGNISFTLDSWYGPSVDHRMSGKDMAKHILAIARAEIEEKTA